MVKSEVKLRNIAQKRQNKAFIYFFGAGILAIAPFILYIFLKVTNISILIYVICWVSALMSAKQGQKLQRFAQNSNRGSQGVGEIGFILDSLQSKRWKIDYNVPMSYLGDAEVVLRSPKGRYFVVNVKEYMGNIFYNGSRLLAVYGDSIYGDQDMLELAKTQAEYLKNMKGVGSVVPIICFTEAHLEAGNTQIQGVYVINKNTLVPLLKKLG